MSQGSQNATGQCHNTTQVNVVTTEFSDLATNCPEYKVTAVQIAPSNGPSDAR